VLLFAIGRYICHDIQREPELVKFGRQEPEVGPFERKLKLEPVNKIIKQIPGKNPKKGSQKKCTSSQTLNLINVTIDIYLLKLGFNGYMFQMFIYVIKFKTQSEPFMSKISFKYNNDCSKSKQIIIYYLL
jgi:hypothetical protein